MFENIGTGHGLESSMQSGSSSRSGRNRASSAAVEADAIGEQQSKRMRSGAAADHESGEQQLKRAQSGSSSWRRRQTGSQQWKRMPQSGPGAAAGGGGKRGASSGSGCRNRAREQQLKRTQSGRSSSSESCPAPDYARWANKGEVAERAKRAQLLVYVYRRVVSFRARAEPRPL